MDDLDFGTTIKGFSPGQKVLNRYTLERILGRGGMGVVWLARDEELEREVALKFLPEVVALDPEAVADLKRETRRNLDLTHPHIVRIHDFVADARTAAIAMEYVNGASLSALKLEKADRLFTLAELRPWLEQLLDALHYAHTKAKVVHRDLKPANLMITREGDLKIADFGIARGISDSVSRVSAQAGSSGTPVYMSPQQMLGEKAAVTDDIYALGATLYELLTGKPPFYAGNVILQVQSKAPPSIAERRKELELGGEPIPTEWEQTIAACLAKEAKDRPQSAREVWHRLRPAENPPAAAQVEVKADGGAVAPGAAVAPKQPATRSKISLRVVLAPLALGLALAGYWQYQAWQSSVEAGEKVQAEREAERQQANTKFREQEAERRHDEAFGAWAGELDREDVFLTPLKYSPEALTYIYEGVKRGAAWRLAQGAYAEPGKAPVEPGQPAPADLVAFIKQPRAAGQEITSVGSPNGYLEAIGWWIAQDRFFPEMEFTDEEWPLFLAGLDLRLAGKPLPHLGDDDQMHFNESIQARQADYARKARQARNTRYFAWLDTQPAIARTASGLRYTIKEEGKGDFPAATSGIRCRFSIRDIDGDFLGSESTTPVIDLRPGDVMPGMWEGLQRVRVGGKIELYIPAALTQVGRLGIYPSEGNAEPTAFPHDMALKVEAEVLAIMPPKSS